MTDSARESTAAGASARFESGRRSMSQLDSGGDRCQKPNCSREAAETYAGENDNRLRLCERHYYSLVSGQGLGSSEIGAPRQRVVDRAAVGGIGSSSNTVDLLDDSGPKRSQPDLG